MKLELNTAQVDVLLRALDVYTRVHLGQFHDIVRQVVQENKHCQEKKIDWTVVDDHAFLLSWHLFDLYPREIITITNEKVSENARVAYDLSQVIRHAKSETFENIKQFSAYDLPSVEKSTPA